MTGPNLYGVYGRKTANEAGFNYSAPMKAANFTWDAAHLDPWLAGPMAFMPGTKMTFAGIQDATDRRDVVAYVALEGGYKP
jgi:cytochrome c